MSHPRAPVVFGDTIKWTSSKITRKKFCRDTVSVIPSLQYVCFHPKHWKEPETLILNASPNPNAVCDERA